MILIINLFFIQYNLLKFISIFLEKNMEFLKDYIDLII
ncbi:TonB-system energizer ExbB, partial [Campylobacter jejuni]|nr:TonB-system energizer ExbB [Campylobacter jejuni]EAL1277401.1 TonB-system energizer ExbB [Campylobacter jejuni]EAL3562539.1 TonB-system energizer ExbB [Campylobacter jejuni]